jgi:hypothetical protein
MLPHGVASEVEISYNSCNMPFDHISFNLELWRQFLGGSKRKVTPREEYSAL